MANDRELDLFDDPPIPPLARVEPTPAAPAPRTCGECAYIKATRHRPEGWFCTESYDDASPTQAACATRFALRVGPCDGCGPACDVFPCTNTDPKEVP